jgi:hypothetical protein
MSEIGFKPKTTIHKVDQNQASPKQEACDSSQMCCDSTPKGVPVKVNSEAISQNKLTKPEQTYVQIDTTKSDSFKFEIKTDPNQKNVDSISFTDEKKAPIKEPPQNKNALKDVIEDITTIGPVKIDDVTIPNPINLPGKDQKSIVQPLTPPPVKDAVSVKLKVKF